LVSVSLDRPGHTGSVLPQVAPDVVKRAQRGDERAYGAIVDAYRLPVFNYVLRTVGDRELAEDLTQEVFLRVWRSLPNFGHRAQLSTWLFQVAKNVILDSVRARESRPRTTELVPELTPAITDVSAEQAETIRELWGAVERLSLDLRTALLLRDIVGLSYNEIAVALDVSLTTVKWRIYKAREQVQLELSELDAARAV
jgi:RNA polymerase sigma-70 factor (ECF subfamily)